MKPVQPRPSRCCSRELRAGGSIQYMRCTEQLLPEPEHGSLRRRHPAPLDHTAPACAGHGLQAFRRCCPAGASCRGPTCCPWSTSTASSQCASASAARRCTSARCGRGGAGRGVPAKCPTHLHHGHLQGDGAISAALVPTRCCIHVRTHARRREPRVVRACLHACLCCYPTYEALQPHVCGPGGSSAWAAAGGWMGGRVKRRHLQWQFLGSRTGYPCRSNKYPPPPPPFPPRPLAGVPGRCCGAQHVQRRHAGPGGGPVGGRDAAGEGRR